jgi:hypothetical protein
MKSSGPGLNEASDIGHRDVEVIQIGETASGIVVRVPAYITEMYCASCEVRTEFTFLYVMQEKVDRLRGLVVRVPGYITEMYCVSCEVRNEFVEESRPPLWSSGQSSRQQNGDVLCPASIPGATRFSDK